MTDVTKPNETLPGMIPDDYADQLMAGVSNARAAMSTMGGGQPLLRMGKDGIWVFGPSSEEVQEGSRWAVNPTTFGHGWVCWIQANGPTKARKAGEIMRSMSEPAPEQPPPAEGKYPYAQQYSCMLKCMNGTDQGAEVLYKGSSMGGTEGMAALIDAFQRHFRLDRAHPCPVVTLENTSYPHPSYGKIYKPVFAVAGWADMNGNMAGNEPPPVLETAKAPEPPKPARQRKPALQPSALDREANEALQQAEEPVPTARAHTGQRRRPAAR